MNRVRRGWLALGGTVVLLTGCAVGEYRMPYEDGTVVVVNADHVTHASPPAYSYDISGLNPLPASIVAAAPGTVRFVVDDNEEPTEQNNYVWIEHPQFAYECGGEWCTEWTVYAHFAKDSVAVAPGEEVFAGSFLGIESDVGDANGVHLHWHVAILPPDVQPTFNGYYLDYYEDLGEAPELIPIVCRQGGEHVLWRNARYTAAGCPAARVAAAATRHQRTRDGFDYVRRQLPKGSPIARAVQRLAGVSDEAVAIALADPELAHRTMGLLTRLRPAFEDLRHLGRARISTLELEMVRDLLAEYEARGSKQMHATLAPLRRMLANPAGAEALGLVVWERSGGLH